MNLIGFDFSINKPAACILNNNTHTFISWPFELSKPQLKVYETSPITLIERTDIKEGKEDVSAKLRFEVKNAKYLAELILNTIKPYVTDDTYIAFEGLSYGSGGNAGLQLSGYKYVLMDVLSSIVPLENMYTYAPITVKKTAGCSKKGMGKKEVIEAFKLTDCNFGKYLKDNEDSFKTRAGNWIAHLDDVVDSYWVVETLKDRLNKLPPALK